METNTGNTHVYINQHISTTETITLYQFVELFATTTYFVYWPMTHESALAINVWKMLRHGTNGRKCVKTKYMHLYTPVHKQELVIEAETTFFVYKSFDTVATVQLHR